MSTRSTPDPRRRWARRPLAVLVAAFLGLGAIAGGAGMVLGALGAAAPHPGVGHMHGDPRVAPPSQH